MGVKSGVTCIRHTLCVVNTTLWIVGCAILVVGLWLRIAHGRYASLLHEYEELSLDVLCLATGVVTFVVAFFACCGAWFRNKCMLMTYLVCLSLVFILQLVSAILVFSFRDTLSAAIRDELKGGLKYSYNESDNNPLGIVWNGLQIKYQCCGVDGPTDWFDVSAWAGEDWVPASCCKPPFDKNPNCGKFGNESIWYEEGCFVKARIWFIRKLHVLGLFVLALTFMQLFGFISSILLICNMKQKKSNSHSNYRFDR